MIHRGLASGAQGSERSLVRRGLRFSMLQAMANANEGHTEAVAQVADAANQANAAGLRQVRPADVVGLGKEIKPALISVNLSDVNRSWVHVVSLHVGGGLKRPLVAHQV
jgi:hypothetical protein